MPELPTQGTTPSFLSLFLHLARQNLTICFFRALTPIVWPHCCWHAQERAADRCAFGLVHVAQSSPCLVHQEHGWARSRCAGVPLDLLLEKIKMERTSLWKRHGFGLLHKSRQTGLHAYFPFPRPKDNGFKSLTLSTVLSPLLHTVSLILVFIDGCANTDILWFLNCVDGWMTLKSISCGSFIFPALDTICPLC